VKLAHAVSTWNLPANDRLRNQPTSDVYSSSPLNLYARGYFLHIKSPIAESTQSIIKTFSTQQLTIFTDQLPIFLKQLSQSSNTNEKTPNMAHLTSVHNLHKKGQIH